jgi:hypothetical protein
VGVRSVFQIHGRRHIVGGTYGIVHFLVAQHVEERRVDVLILRGAGVQRRCTCKHPPGRKVYQRGAHTIWEVDGAKEKVCMQSYNEPVIFFLMRERAAVLPEPVVIREVVYRH